MYTFGNNTLKAPYGFLYKSVFEIMTFLSLRTQTMFYTTIMNALSQIFLQNFHLTRKKNTNHGKYFGNRKKATTNFRTTPVLKLILGTYWSYYSDEINVIFSTHEFGEKGLHFSRTRWHKTCYTLSSLLSPWNIHSIQMKLKGKT